MKIALEARKPYDFNKDMPQPRREVIMVNAVDEDGEELRDADDNPIRIESQDADGNTMYTELEMSQTEIIAFTQKMNQHTKREADYTDQMLMAFALIHGQCTPEIKNKLESLDHWEDRVNNDPIELLKELEKITHDYQERDIRLLQYMMLYTSFSQSNKKTMRVRRRTLTGSRISGTLLRQCMDP